MLSTDIQNLLLMVAETASTNEKVSLLSEFLQDEDFRDVVTMAYDPFMRYGVLQTPAHSIGTGVFREETKNLLIVLSKRHLTGNAALEAIGEELSYLDGPSGELFKKILKKDLEAGFNVASINKAYDGLIPEFSYMRCSLPKEVDLSKFDWDSGCYVQLKADGSYTTFNDDAGGQNFSALTRKGHEYPRNVFGAIESDLYKANCPGFQTQGELLVKRDGTLLSRKIGNGVLNRVRKGGAFEKNEEPHYFIWDMVPMSVALGIRKDYKRTYEERLTHLQDLFLDRYENVSLIDTEVVHSYSKALDYAKRQQRAGLEGAILKDPRGLWIDGTSKWQVKIKKEFRCELRVISILPGTGRNSSTMGSLFCVSECGMLSVGVPGFDDDTRKDIVKNPGKYINGVISVLFESVIEDDKGEYSLYLPRFDELREDLNYADDLQRIKLIESL